MPSRTHKRHRMRCSKKNCRARFTLKKHPKYIKKDIVCPRCGTDKVHTCEAARRRELRHSHTCNLYPFPHRKGSLRMCSEHPLFGQEPTDEEIESYERIMDTPRSG